MSSVVSGDTQRRANRERVVAALRRQGAMTRAALADVGLSRSTVQSVIEELAEAGMVIEIGPDTAPASAARRSWSACAAVSA